MKAIKLIFISLLVVSSSYAQSITVPKQYTLKTERDLDKYEHHAIECANFLINTPSSQQLTLRKEASAFMTDYITASNSVKIEVNYKATPFLKNQELLAIYKASWFRSYSSQNHVNNKEEFTIRAAQETLNYYQSNQSTIGKVKEIKSSLKMQSAGTLDTFIKANL